MEVNRSDEGAPCMGPQLQVESLPPNPFGIPFDKKCKQYRGSNGKFIKKSEVENAAY